MNGDTFARRVARCGTALTAILVLASGGKLAFGTELDLSLFFSPPGDKLPQGALSSLAGSVFNGGTSPATNTKVTLTLSSNLTYITGSSSQGSITQDMSNPFRIEFKFGTIPSFGGASWQATLRALVEGDGNIHGVATPLEGDGNTNDNEFTFTFDVLGKAYRTWTAGVGAYAGEPVSTFSGKEMLTERADLDLGGIFFQRHYDGALFEDGVIQSALGHNWQYNYDIRLTIAGTNATIGFREGRVIRFAHDGANWNLTGRTDIGFKLSDVGAERLLADPRSQVMYFFDANGFLVRIENGRGYTNFLSYAGVLLTNATDGLGRTLNFSYDTSGLLTNVSDGVRHIRFMHTGTNLTSVTDALGNVTTYAYTATTNNPGLMTARTLPEGNTPVTQIYDALGRVVAQVDAANNTNTFSYAEVPDALNTVMADPLGGMVTHRYNLFGELSQLTDEAGNSILAFQDDDGRRNAVQDRKGSTTLITYDPDSGLPTEIRPPPGNVFDTFIYSNRTVNGVVFNDLALVGHQDFRTNGYSYDAAGNLTQFLLRDGAAFNYGYNNRGQITSVTNPLGGVATFTYDASARLASASNSDVGATTYQYDSLNRLTNFTHPDPDSVRFTYDALDRLTSVTDERGHVTAFAYDRNSRLTNVTDALNQQTRFTYDSLDRLVRSEDRLGNAAAFSYDPRNDLASITNRNGFITHVLHDARRRLTGVVNPAGKTNRFGYDAEGLLTSITNPLGQALTLTRDPMGYLIRVRDALGNSVGLQRDTMKRVIGVTNALANKTTYAYTPRGQLQSAMLPGAITSTNHYDPLGSLTNLVDPNNRNWNFAYTLMGRLARFTDPLNRTNTYAYDSRGRLSRTTYADGVTLTNTYDGANNVTRLQFSDGTDLQFAYDPLNRLTNAAGSDPISFSYDAMSRVTNTRQVGLDFSATYDADGRLTSVSYSNGLFTVNYAYDNRDRLVSVSDTLTLTSLTFSYDDADRLISITRPNGVNATYTYDAAGRLTRIQEGSIIDLRYVLDANGNIIETDYVAVPIHPASAVTIENDSLTFDFASQISTAGYSYDSRGRLTNSPAAILTWDAASRLRSINNVSLAYNALGDLVTRTESGNTNRFFYNYALRRRPILAERNDNTDQFTRFHVWTPGGRLLYVINLPGNTVSFPHFDQVGSTLALTGTGGTVTDSYAYDPYGRLLSRTGTSQQPFLFNGQFGVRADGPFHHMRARWYDANTSRFISKEPIWPVLANPMQLNVYQFALQNPVRFVDPMGTDASDEGYLGGDWGVLFDPWIGVANARFYDPKPDPNFAEDLRKHLAGGKNAPEPAPSMDELLAPFNVWGDEMLVPSPFGPMSAPQIPSPSDLGATYNAGLTIETPAPQPLGGRLSFGQVLVYQPGKGVVPTQSVGPPPFTPSDTIPFIGGTTLTREQVEQAEEYNRHGRELMREAILDALEGDGVHFFGVSVTVAELEVWHRFHQRNLQIFREALLDALEGPPLPNINIRY